MATIPLQEPTTKIPANKFALFELGFRPFFLFAGVVAVILMPLWLWMYKAGRVIEGPITFQLWHANEMLFGYSVAVIAGFLLTAVPNWTGIKTVKGFWLAALLLLFLLPRFSLLIPAVPVWLTALLDISFLPMLAAALATPLIRAGKIHNLIFIPLLLVMAALHAAVYFAPAWASTAMLLETDLILLLITIIGGRVIGFFTERGLGMTFKTRSWAAVEYALIAGMLLLVFVDGVAANGVWVVILSLALMILHGIRLAGWWTNKMLSVPLIWVLQFGYAWMVIGFALKAAAVAGLVSPMLAMHAFTAGVIGGLTLGMMARVSIGHTGREMVLQPVMLWSFVLLNIAAVVRVFFPLVSGLETFAILISGILWTLAFLIFLWVYTPILIRPRVDGQPG